MPENLDQMPPEIIEEISKFLSQRDIKNLYLVSKEMSQLTEIAEAGNKEAKELVTKLDAMAEKFEKVAKTLGKQKTMSKTAKQLDELNGVNPAYARSLLMYFKQGIDDFDVGAAYKEIKADPEKFPRAVLAAAKRAQAAKKLLKNALK